MNIIDSKNFAQSEGKITIALPVEIRKGGFTYILYKRGNKAMIYAQKGVETQVYYEVWLIRVSKEKKFPDGSIILPKEIFPKAEAFGRYGWTYRNIEKAIEKFNQLEGIGK